MQLGIMWDRVDKLALKYLVIYKYENWEYFNPPIVRHDHGDSETIKY